MYPLPNSNNGVVHNNYVANLNNTYQWDTRVDWNISPKDQTFARFSYSNQHQYLPSPLGRSSMPIMATATMQISARTLLEAKPTSSIPASSTNFASAITLEISPRNSSTPTRTSPASLAWAAFPSAESWGLVNVSISGISGFGTPYYYPTLENEHVLEILDNVTKIIGNHALKIGVDFQPINVSELQPVIATGGHTFDGKYTGIPGVANSGITSAPLSIRGQAAILLLRAQYPLAVRSLGR
jgi:hypothetical protein